MTEKEKKWRTRRLIEIVYRDGGELSDPYIDDEASEVISLGKREFLGDRVVQ